ncbi:MAG: HupE/UreJ family protein [Pseudomonadota bacterium]
MPYLVADKLGQVGVDGLPRAAPYTVNGVAVGGISHSVDWEALRVAPLGLGEIFENALDLRQDAQRLRGKVVEVVVREAARAPNFETLAQAQAVFKEPPQALIAETPANAREPGVLNAVPRKSTTSSASPLFVGDAVVDIKLQYPTPSGLDGYTLATTLDPQLPEQDQTVSIVIDHAVEGTDFYNSRGLLHEPLRVERASFAALRVMVAQGIAHILEGLDHVLFVLCLTVGASGPGALLGRVTAFTLGHCVTLSLGFFGYVPTASWFIPAVETAIAASIVFAAMAAFRRSNTTVVGEGSMYVLIGGIGLLHGLGFSFVLHNILSLNAPNLWESLLAFNLGIEMGQIAVVLVALSLLQLLRVIGEDAESHSRSLLAAACGIVGSYWMFDRAAGVLG